MTNDELDALLSAFADAQLDDGRSANTISAYRCDIMQFVTFAGMPEAWTTRMIEEFKAAMLAKRSSVLTVNRKVVAIRRFSKFLSDQGHSMPAKIRTVRVQAQEFLQDVMTAEDTDRIVRIAMEKRDYRTWAIIAGLQKTGCRVSELLQWRVGDVGKARIQVVGKGMKVRDLLVPPSLTPTLELYAAGRVDPQEPLFMNPKTKKAITRQRIDQIIKRYAKLAKVKKDRAHAHSLRHQHGQRLKEMGLTAENIAAIDGHSSTRTTDIYTQKTERELRAIINKL